MPANSSFDYVIVRVVPHVERQEFINVGVILFCRTRQFLDACIEVNPARLRVLAPQINLAQVTAYLNLIPQICAGDSTHPIGRLSQAERFHWLVTPRSTSVQVSPVHSGICTEPAAALERLMNEMVRLDD